MNIDNLTNSIISKHSQNKRNSIEKISATDRISEDEPNFVITTKWFKKWKTVHRTYITRPEANDVYNSIMSKLEKLEKVTIDINRSGVNYDGWAYHLNIYWRNA